MMMICSLAEIRSRSCSTFPDIAPLPSLRMVYGWCKAGFKTCRCIRAVQIWTGAQMETIPATESPPVREVLPRQRDAERRGAAGVLTRRNRDRAGGPGGDAGSWPGFPYLDTIRWLFIAVALPGTFVAIYARIGDRAA